jgi:hypothetical protein
MRNEKKGRPPVMTLAGILPQSILMVLAFSKLMNVPNPTGFAPPPLYA